MRPISRASTKSSPDASSSIAYRTALGTCSEEARSRLSSRHAASTKTGKKPGVVHFLCRALTSSARRRAGSAAIDLSAAIRAS